MKTRAEFENEWNVGKIQDCGNEQKVGRSGFLLTLALPPETDIDRLRLKRGDSVVLSATHPLKDKARGGFSNLPPFILIGSLVHFGPLVSSV